MVQTNVASMRQVRPRKRNLAPTTERLLFFDSPSSVEGLSAKTCKKKDRKIRLSGFLHNKVFFTMHISNQNTNHFCIG